MSSARVAGFCPPGRRESPATFTSASSSPQQDHALPRRPRVFVQCVDEPMTVESVRGHHRQQHLWPLNFLQITQLLKLLRLLRMLRLWLLQLLQSPNLLRRVDSLLLIPRIVEEGRKRSQSLNLR
ncbi:hypothetical protein NKR19_g9285 [Coniochaeta hoffmannii]|uniref:Uncharacterized protein n=1 Tax=Coniochaeta hoffmannii TaxID=91930 RepID=A0AA38VHK1_9PEZI|nr:hypothetical protein NKR19_g9285 [Coniochaeta hoffmannii]